MDRLDSIAVSVFVWFDLTLINTDQKQELKKLWLWDELACLVVWSFPKCFGFRAALEKLGRPGTFNEEQEEDEHVEEQQLRDKGDHQMFSISIPYIPILGRRCRRQWVTVTLEFWTQRVTLETGDPLDIWSDFPQLFQAFLLTFSFSTFSTFNSSSIPSSIVRVQDSHPTLSPLYDLLDHINQIFSESLWHPLSTDPPTTHPTWPFTHYIALLALQGGAHNRGAFRDPIPSISSIDPWWPLGDHLVTTWWL